MGYNMGGGYKSAKSNYITYGMVGPTFKKRKPPKTGISLLFNHSLFTLN